MYTSRKLLFLKLFKNKFLGYEKQNCNLPFFLSLISTDVITNLIQILLYTLLFYIISNHFRTPENKDGRQKLVKVNQEVASLKK